MIYNKKYIIIKKKEAEKMMFSKYLLNQSKAPLFMNYGNIMTLVILIML